MSLEPFSFLWEAGSTFRVLRSMATDDVYTGEKVSEEMVTTYHVLTDITVSPVMFRPWRRCFSLKR